MAAYPDVGDIAHAIQLSLAPAFLLNGVAALLNIKATRLARVIDRARHLEESWPAMDGSARIAARREMTVLERRRKVCSWAINFSTVGALLVSLVIVTLFAAEFVSVRLRFVAGGMFAGAMLVVICGLTSFLREVYLATHTIKIDHTRFE